MMPNDVKKLTQDELFDHMGMCQPGAPSRGMYEAEAARRKATQDDQVAAAQIKAAMAQETTAAWTKWSVAAAAVSAATAALGIWLHNGCS